ncbi:MAG: phosphate transport system protein [Candidatus Azotimanducaceae bacterium]|jgi:phosphate transport system protein
MSKHLERDLVGLSDMISDLGAMVVESTAKAMIMLQNFDLVIVDEILEVENRINEIEVEIEEECLKVMALHQPVAIDLRFIMVVLKVNNDLERMADQIVNIANRISFLVDQKRVVVDLEFIKMGEISSRMVRHAVDALVNRDSLAAREVLKMDDELDALHAQSYAVLQDLMRQKPGMVAPAVSYLTISSNLERLGDLATNIAEEVIFMMDGEVVRHHI